VPVAADPVTRTTTTDVGTPVGPARLVLDRPATAHSLLVLGHGAGGDVDSVDLVAVRDAAVRAGVAVARMTQPYRLAGRRSPAPVAQLDTAFTAAVGAARTRELAGLPLLVGGRSSGARVACRCAAALGASGVLALAFPTHPPGRPDRTRASELPTCLPTLVVNGDRDPFGAPPGGGVVEVRVLPGETHALRRDTAAVAALVLGWLVQHGWARPIG
jgi:uncharacterized protein